MSGHNLFSVASEVINTCPGADITILAATKFVNCSMILFPPGDIQFPGDGTDKSGEPATVLVYTL